MAYYQIRLKRDGWWHRRPGDLPYTACGEIIGTAFLSRDPILDEKLCPVCFTPRERDTGELLLLERYALEQAEADAYMSAEIENEIIGDTDVMQIVKDEDDRKR